MPDVVSTEPVLHPEPIKPEELEIPKAEVEEVVVQTVRHTQVSVSVPETDDNILYRICSCESGNGKYGTPQQFEPDGVTPLVGKMTPDHLGQDIGMCQINTKYHLETATSLGYDIYTADGNWGYAKYLYSTQGTNPWSASRSCWQ